MRHRISVRNGKALTQALASEAAGSKPPPTRRGFSPFLTSAATASRGVQHIQNDPSQKKKSPKSLENQTVQEEKSKNA